MQLSSEEEDKMGWGVSEGLMFFFKKTKLRSRFIS